MKTTSHPFSHHLIRRRTALLLVALASAVLTGCDAAKSRQPIGRQPAALTDLHLEGTWRDGDGRTYYVRVVDPAAARLEVATLKTNASGFLLNRSELFLRDEAGTLFAGFRDVAPDPEEDYLVGRLSVSDGAMVFLAATATGVRSIVLEDGIGAIVTTNSDSGSNRYSVTVTNGFDRIARRLAGPEGSRFVDAEHPFVLMRQKAGLD